MSIKIKKVCIIGLGYVGLPTAVAFAKSGLLVIGADIDKRKIDTLNSGRSYIPEILPDSEIALLIKSKKLEATADVPRAVNSADAVLITVPTPITKDKLPDLTAVKSASELVAKGLKKGHLVVLESTVYPGVTEEITQPILEKTGLKAGRDFGLAYCPERYNPGDRDHTINKIARVVGAIDKKWLEVAYAMYSRITTAKVHKVSNIKTAEAAKIIENIQRDLNVALMNELALIFDKMGIDTREVIDAASTKWNFHVYYPGPGVGGHCLPVDPYYLVYKARQLGYNSKVITAGREINNYMPHHVVELVERGFKKKGIKISGSRVSVLGVSYKGNIRDARETPAEHIIAELKQKGAKVFVYDPLVKEEKIIEYGATPSTLEESVKNSDCIVIHSDHEDFKKLNLRKLGGLMKSKIIVDTRGFVDKKTAEHEGFLLLRI